MLKTIISLIFLMFIANITFAINTNQVNILTLNTNTGFLVNERNITATNKWTFNNIIINPSQEYITTLTPPASSGTNMLNYTNGALVKINPTGAQTIAWHPIASGGWPTSGVCRQRVDIGPSAYTITIQSNSAVVWAAPINPSTTKTLPIIAQIIKTNVVLYPLVAQ